MHDIITLECHGVEYRFVRSKIATLVKYSSATLSIYLDNSKHYDLSYTSKKQMEEAYYYLVSELEKETEQKNRTFTVSDETTGNFFQTFVIDHVSSVSAHKYLDDWTIKIYTVGGERIYKFQYKDEDSCMKIFKKLSSALEYRIIEVDKKEQGDSNKRRLDL